MEMRNNDLDNSHSSSLSAVDRPYDISNGSSARSCSSNTITDQLTGHLRNDGDDATVPSNRKHKPNSKTGYDTGITSSVQTRQKVRQVKLVIVMVLLISIAGAVAVFFYTQRSEQNDFESQFTYDANKV